MVHKTQTKRKRDIKTKLMAAICMLLVSSIMMVSTTYAWFTLSTAPEVTGISTAVGANGNLEMALLPADQTGHSVTDNFGITSEAGDSTKAVDQKNTTWGNLVDVSENTFYGLDKITLNPSALNLTEAGTLDAAMLQTPSYGADGRVGALLKNTTTSTFNGTNFPQNSEYGVRAVGTASGMTDRQLAYRNNLSAANTAMALAKSTSSTSLNTNGAALANIAIAHAANQGTEKYTAADINSLEAIVDDLLGVEGSKTGVLEYIENAYRNYILASAASGTSPITDDQYKAFEAAINAAADLYAAVDVCAAHSVTLPATFTTPIAALEATRAKVEQAKTGLAGITAEKDIVWGDFSTYLTLLADTSAMKINSYPASSFRENMSDIINGVASQGLTVTIASGGGVYADVADHCGDFNASIVIEEVTYQGLTLKNMNAKMTTDTELATVNLDVIGAAVKLAGAPTTGEGGQTMPISDFFGYIIDLAFRTNAAESNLLLQTDAADRIYDENGADAETMGHGSTMTFTSTTTDFKVEQLKSLMSAIRVVFFDPMASNKVLGTAKLDMTEDKIEVTGGNTITAKLYLYGMGADTVQYTESADGTYKLLDGEYVEIAEDETYDGTKYVQTVTPGVEQKLTGNDAVIKALTQNTATTVSALVYLDGANITNADVAATASTSMTGTMNLQFASSANLVPMEYTPLIVDNGTPATTTPATTAGNG